MEVRLGREMAAHVLQTVVSVGPYTLNATRTASTMSPASSAGTASPPTSAVSFARRSFRSLSLRHERTNPRHVVGVACTKVTSSRAMRSDSALGSAAVSRDANTVLPPTQRGRKSSRPAMSKHTVVTAQSTTLVSTPVVSSME